jgi:hypothetical protein
MKIFGLQFGEAARAAAPERGETREGISSREAAQWITDTMGDLLVNDGDGNQVPLREAFTQADIELALDDRGWLVGGKRMAGELDPLSRQVQVNKSRYYWLRDPLVQQAVRLWTDYTLGDTGVDWDCEDAGVKQGIDDFMKSVRNRRLCSPMGQDRLSKKLLVDGELFLCQWDDGLMRDFDCLTITDLITDPDDEDTVWGYKRVMMPRYGGESPSYYAQKGVNQTLYYYSWEAEGDEPLYDPSKGPDAKVQAESDGNPKIYHLPFNSLSQRGNPLISSCSDWSREHRRFLTLRVAITQALGKFAFKATVKGGQKMINTVRQKLESTFAQTGLSGGTEHQPDHAAGSTWLQNDGISLDSMPRVTGASEAKTDADNLKLLVAAGTGIMLHYFGDPSTGNLATATAMELPMFMKNQVFWRGAWRDMMGRAIGEDVNTPESKKADIKIVYPNIIEEDLAALAQFLTSVTGVFPEAKVPSLLRQSLASANVPNLDEVMDEIKDNKDQMDANVSQGLNPDGSKPVPVQVANMKNGQGDAQPSDGDQSLGATDGNTGSLEADRMGRLTAAVNRLAESMR